METKEKLKKLCIITYGCQMNVYDSERMADLMLPFGFTETKLQQDADMIILNTCHIREKATEKLYSELGRIRKIKDERLSQGLQTYIVVAGCVSQAEGDEIFKRAPIVNIVVGPQSYHTLPHLFRKLLDEQKMQINLEFEEVKKFDGLPQDTQNRSASRFLMVQEGCDKFCSFCVVPYTRGAEYSRPVSDIFREALSLVNVGASEINLVGQNVNAYHGAGPDGKDWNLGRLILELANIDKVKRIRYTTSHPIDMHEELYLAHKECDKLMPYLHLPVQSGSNSILRDMNRRHTREDYLRVIEKMRMTRSDIAFSSDFIVGFPGETDKDFQETLDLARRVSYASSYSFKYSVRPGTPAGIRPQIEENIKTERLAELQKLLGEQQMAFNKSFEGKEIEVLLDRQGKFSEQLQGKSPYLQSVYVENAQVYKGEYVKVKITDGFYNSLKGNIL